MRWKPLHPKLQALDRLLGSLTWRERYVSTCLEKHEDRALIEKWSGDRLRSLRWQVVTNVCKSVPRLNDVWSYTCITKGLWVLRYYDISVWPTQMHKVTSNYPASPLLFLWLYFSFFVTLSIHVCCDIYEYECIFLYVNKIYNIGSTYLIYATYIDIIGLCLFFPSLSLTMQILYVFESAPGSSYWELATVHVEQGQIFDWHLQWS